MTPARLESIDLHRRKTLRIAAVAGLIPLGLLGGPQGLSLAQAETAGSPQPRVRVRWGVDGNHDGDGAGERGSDTPSLALGDTVIVRLEVWVSTWFLAPIDFPATLASTTALGKEAAVRLDDVGVQAMQSMLREWKPAQRQQFLESLRRFEEATVLMVKTPLAEL